MSPTSRRHGRLQAIVAAWFETNLKGGCAVSEPAVLTRAGVRVADVGWASRERYDAQPEELFREAPEICVEIWSPSNTPEEFEEKRALYFAAGALEVWECDAEGRVRFFAPEGELEGSRLAAGFPVALEG